MAPDAKPLANVNVLLLNVVDSALIKGNITDNAGQFFPFKILRMENI